MVELDLPADAKALTFNAFALIIAIADYKTVSSLPRIVHNDANDIRNTLIAQNHCGYPSGNVRLLLDSDATLANIRSELSWLANAAGPSDSVIFYFSGHGVLLKGIANGASALVPWDADIKDVSSTCLAENELSETLRKISSARLLVLLDACHSGGSVVLKGDDEANDFHTGFQEKSLEHLGQGSGRVAIASSRSSETSLILPGASNSVFTAHLLEVLRGNEPSKGDGFIRVFQIFEHIAQAVPQSTKDLQHPLMKTTELEMNFPVALDKGGKKQVAVDPPKFPIRFDWKRLEDALAELYPLGPVDRELWLRSGGDLSRLKLNHTGRTAWFSSLMYLRQGGGDDAFLKTLIAEALSDFPNHNYLRELASSL
jgi:hypothetical protein